VGLDRIAIAVVCGVFARAYLPSAMSLAVYHGDERFYTDAALEMARGGD